MGKVKRERCKSCKRFKNCINFAGSKARVSDEICPLYLPKKIKKENENEQKSTGTIR